MKNLYSSKSKGKIHPVNDAAAALKLLPAAIFALTVALAVEDKEVLAYLMLRSLAESSSSSAAAEKRRKCRRIAGVHRPLFDCGCFDCYTSFWSRWDHSADRDVIHMAIEAFEEHLLTSEKKGKEKRKRNKKAEEEEKVTAVAEVAEESKGPEVVTLSENECSHADVAREEAVSVSEADAEKEEEEVVEVGAAAAVSAAAERRRGWADVVGMFNSRLWSLWSPGG